MLLASLGRLLPARSLLRVGRLFLACGPAAPRGGTRTTDRGPPREYGAGWSSQPGRHLRGRAVPSACRLGRPAVVVVSTGVSAAARAACQPFVGRGVPRVGPVAVAVRRTTAPTVAGIEVAAANPGDPACCGTPADRAGSPVEKRCVVTVELSSAVAAPAAGAGLGGGEPGRLELPEDRQLHRLVRELALAVRGGALPGRAWAAAICAAAVACASAAWAAAASCAAAAAAAERCASVCGPAAPTAGWSDGATWRVRAGGRTVRTVPRDLGGHVQRGGQALRHVRRAVRPGRR